MGEALNVCGSLFFVGCKLWVVIGMLSIVKKEVSVFDCMPLFCKRACHLIKRLTNTPAVFGMLRNRNGTLFKKQQTTDHKQLPRSFFVKYFLLNTINAIKS